jgi:KUP system potassium uptake protein
MVLAAERDDDRRLEVADVESGLDAASLPSSAVDRQDSLFREAVRGGHHAGAAGHSEQVRLSDEARLLMHW